MKNSSPIRAHALIGDKKIHAFYMPYAIPK